MKIEYFMPLGRAWERMKNALFRPFDLHKWFLVGFNAFLAGLMEGPGRSGGAQYNEGGDFSFREFIHFPGRAWEWLLSHPGWFVGIVFITLAVITLIVVLTWLSSRGTFMFLDNVVHNHCEIGKPWNDYRNQGNALFLWRLGFGFAIFGYMILFFAFFFSTGAALNTARGGDRIPIFFLIGSGLFFLLSMVVIGFIAMFLKNFVVPIMYKHRIPTNRAWGRFLVLFKQYSLHFVLYGLFIFVLSFLVFAAIVIAGLMTCCVGFILLIIPYIGTVFTLPAWYTLRAFSLEYLAQFGPEYNIFPPAEDPPRPAAA